MGIQNQRNWPQNMVLKMCPGAVICIRYYAISLHLQIAEATLVRIAITQ